MKPNTEENIQQIKFLRYLMKGYDGITEEISKIKQRHHQLCPEMDIKHDPLLGGEEGAKGLLTVKGIASRRLEKQLQHFKIYSHWLSKVPGIGPAFAAELILLYGYRFTPVCECGTPLVKKEVIDEEKQKTFNTFWCESCQKSVKGEGNLKFSVVERDFPKISAWLSYMGRGNGADGKQKRRQSGVQCNWSTEGRTLGYLIATSFVKQPADKCLYRKFYEERKAKAERDHPDTSAGHRNMMAMNETVKLFLSHFWTVARHLDGKQVSSPYAFGMLQHSPEHYIKPPYFDEEIQYVMLPYQEAFLKAANG